MDLSDQPDKIPLPWAANASPPYINAIPTPSQVGILNGGASWSDGWPPLTFVPIWAGGYPPRGADGNGVLHQISAGLQWLQAGGGFSYDAAFATVIGGYPQGAVVKSNFYSGLLWVSLVDANIDDPDAPGVSSWLPFNRWRLTANTTFYVNDITGADTNNGLAPATPFKTITRANQVLQNFVDLSGFIATVRIAAGNYSSPIILSGNLPGQNGAASVVFLAQDGPVNITTISPFSSAVDAVNGAAFTLAGDDFVLSAPSGPTEAVVACISSRDGGSFVNIDGSVTYGLGRDAHVYCSASSVIRYATGLTETITDDAETHWLIDQGLVNLALGDLSLTLTGTPAFSTAFVVCQYGVWRGDTLNVAGSATGVRYLVSLNGTINTDGGGANFFPGDAPGTADGATGGVYA